MTLTKVLDLISVKCDDKRLLQGISDDSRMIQKDWLFISRKGKEVNGDDYVEEVLKKGGIVLSEKLYDKENCYVCKDIEKRIPELLYIYYGDLCKGKTVIGVTGTNGKSSVTDILKQMLQMHGNKVMTIGTNWIIMEDQQFPINNTTPSIFILAYYFYLANTLNITHIIMEVSSHAIDQKRIENISFDFIIYTNITHDHLDYHLTLTHYQYTKFKLRKYLKKDGIIILNNDDCVLESLYALSDHKIITVGKKEAHMSIRDITLKSTGSSFNLHGFHFQTRLLSMANIYNITEALALCRRIGMSYQEIQKYVSSLSPVKGRLECIQTEKFTVWIDYAHTFMAVKTLVDFANSIKEHHLIIVIGCGGEREIEKRSEIGDYCAKYCDRCIFTSDNPRREPLEKILRDMTPVMHNHIEIIENRFYALKHAVKIAEKDDIIIVAGKGNEETQTIGDKKYPFHDETCVYKILEREELSWF